MGIPPREKESHDSQGTRQKPELNFLEWLFLQERFFKSLGHVVISCNRINNKAPTLETGWGFVLLLIVQNKQETSGFSLAHVYA